MISTRPHRLSQAIRRCLAVAAAAIVMLASLPTVVAFNERAIGGAAMASTQDLVAEPATHLVVSEVMTGGASASDEFIEIYNPGPDALPLEGLEVIYVTASGGTVTRKASWAAGAPSLPPGNHVLIANDLGVFAGVADVTYTNGLAATGGSVAIRILGASSAIDAAGWGNATSTWLEGVPATPPPAGHSLERLPGGSQGSGQDSDQNSVDFFDLAAPDPQNTLSPPIPVATPRPSGSPAGSPTATASPTIGETPEPTSTGTATFTPEPSLTPSPEPTVTPSASPSTASPLTIAAARAMPDGSVVTVEGITLTESAFTDGGGYLVDASGGIAILLSDGSYARGQQVSVTGTVDDRFSQRTIRTDASAVRVNGPGVEPAAEAASTGGIGESLEGELIVVAGAITATPSTLTSGIALDLDDGRGVLRVLVSSATGIDTTGWARGATLQLQGVVGQRDSSGTGTAGYRLQPRDGADILGFVPPPTPTPSASGSASGSPSPSGDPSLMSIADARVMPFNARVSVRGIVSLPSDLADEGSAAIQDSSGAILLRLGDEAGSLALGDLIELTGTRSTKAGMETIRVVDPPRRLGHQAQPDPRRRGTGALAEAEEALLVVVRGAVTTSPRRTSAENVYFDVDDGSGPIRVFVSPRSEARTDGIVLGSWVEVRGILGQETTGRLPDRGYRIWPRIAGDLVIVAAATGSGSPDGGAPGNKSGAGTAGAANPGANAAASAGAAQQGVPRLALAAATASVRPVLPTMILRAGESREPAPAEAAAGLLMVGGLLLGGSGWLVVPPGRPGQLLAALRARLGPREEPGEGDPPAPTADPLPTLVPLTVIEGATHGSRSGASVYSPRPEP